jgi:SpoVK/Ycf46/Vps4 family AAA+-type ATPase
MSKRLYIPLPNSVARKQLIENIIRKNKFPKYEVDDNDLGEIIKRSKGYSGSDMMHVCKEASMMSIRSAENRISSIDPNDLRAVKVDDFLKSLKVVKPSVSEKTIDQYIKWNEDFGSFQFDLAEVNN